MEKIIIDEIEVYFNTNKHIKALGLLDDTEQKEVIEKMAEEAIKIARPKLMYRPFSIDETGEDFAIVNGQRLQSRVLSVNVKDIHIVFPFVATCGMELHNWSMQFEDPMQKDWARSICMQALYLGVGKIRQDITERFGHKKIAMMNPGSIESWPITEQTKIFSLLEDVTEKTGVVLEENMFMTPSMSASGIFFPNDKDFENCAMCPNLDCPGRRAPYDKDMYDRDYK